MRLFLYFCVKIANKILTADNSGETDGCTADNSGEMESFTADKFGLGRLG